jgi:RNA polymerase I-specific transcription initiation factor RRN7
MVDACEQCGSTRFHIDNGLRYCSNGHEQAGGQQIADDADEYGTQGKRTKAKKEKGKAKASKIYRGPLAYKLFLQAYQHIMWKQCYALIHKKSLPAEFWTVVRDLWTLRLAKQAGKLEKSSDPDSESQKSSRKAETSEESENERQNVQQESGKKASDSPVLVETISLCYLGILLMRLPISIADMYRYARAALEPNITIDLTKADGSGPTTSPTLGQSDMSRRKW